MKTLRPIALLLAAFLVFALAAACSSKKSSSGPSGNGNTITIGAATPSQGNFAAAACFDNTSGAGTGVGGVNECIVFFESTPTSPAGVINNYFIQMPATKWANGTIQLTIGTAGDPTVDAVEASFNYELNTSTQKASVTGVATAGSFTLSGINGLQPGATFGFSDTESLNFANNAVVGTNRTLVGTGGVGGITAGTLSSANAFSGGLATALNGTVKITLSGN